MKVFILNIFLYEKSFQWFPLFGMPKQNWRDCTFVNIFVMLFSLRLIWKRSIQIVMDRQGLKNESFYLSMLLKTYIVRELFD